MRTLLNFAALLSSLMLFLCIGSLAYARQDAPKDDYWLVYWREYGLWDHEIWRLRLLDGSQSPLPAEAKDAVGFPCSTFSSPNSEWLILENESCGGTDNDVETNLKVVHIITGHVHQLTFLAGGEWFEGFSLDGEWVYFRHDPINGQYSGDLYRVRLNGDDLQQLTHDADYQEWKLQWSPDGEWIYFRSILNGDWWQYALGRMRPDGSDSQILGGMSHQQTFADVSPNGKWIVYGSGLRIPLIHDRWLYRARADGSDPRVIFPRPLSQLPVNYSWSADGEWLIFDTLNGTDNDLVKLRVSDGFIQRLMATSVDEKLPYSRSIASLPPEANITSPDGEWVYFNRPGVYPATGMACGDPPIDLYRARMDGSDVQQLTSNESSDLHGEEWVSSWSPDGEWLVFHSVYGGCSGATTHRMRRDGRDWENLDTRGGAFIGWAKTPHHKFSVSTLGFWVAQAS